MYLMAHSVLEVIIENHEKVHVGLLHVVSTKGVAPFPQLLHESLEVEGRTAMTQYAPQQQAKTPEPMQKLRKRSKQVALFA